MKKLDYFIRQNKETIETHLSRGGPIVTHNYKNWIKHEIYNENKILFPFSKTNLDDIAPEFYAAYRLNYTEMDNQQNALEYMINSPFDKIDEEMMCTIHDMLCKNTDHIGGIFRRSNKTLRGLNIVPPDYSRIGDKIARIFDYLSDDRIPALNKALKFHYDIIAIQPFEDYNKRIARLMMNWILWQNGYTPILFNRKNDRNVYLDALEIRKRNQAAYDATMQKRLCRNQEQSLTILTTAK